MCAEGGHDNSPNAVLWVQRFRRIALDAEKDLPDEKQRVRLHDMYTGASGDLFATGKNKRERRSQMALLLLEGLGLLPRRGFGEEAIKCKTAVKRLVLNPFKTLGSGKTTYGTSGLCSLGVEGDPPRGAERSWLHSVLRMLTHALSMARMGLSDKTEPHVSKNRAL